LGLQVLDTRLLRFAEAELPELFIESWSNAVRTVLIRGFTIHGTLSFNHTTNGDRSRATDAFRLPEFPVMIQASPEAVPVRRGELYVRITLRLGGFPVGRLSAGYLTDSKTITWPPGVFEHFVSGLGLLRSITIPNPGAGNEISETVPTNTVWHVRGMMFGFVTDATVATRRVTVQFDDGGLRFIRTRAAQTQAASQDLTYSLTEGVGGEDTIGQGGNQIHLPSNIRLFQGWRIRTLTDNMQAGDYYRDIQLYVEEWIEE